MFHAVSAHTASLADPSEAGGDGDDLETKQTRMRASARLGITPKAKSKQDAGMYQHRNWDAECQNAKCVKISNAKCIDLKCTNAQMPNTNAKSSTPNAHMPSANTKCEMRKCQMRTCTNKYQTPNAKKTKKSKAKQTRKQAMPMQTKSQLRHNCECQWQLCICSKPAFVLFYFVLFCFVFLVSYRRF